MEKVVKAVLRVLSHGEHSIEQTRKLSNIKKINFKKQFYHTIDKQFEYDNKIVPFRCYIPKNKVDELKGLEENTLPIILYLHGGGFVSDSIDTYDKVCWNLANVTDHLVIAVEYALAPECPFPRPIEDCYQVAKALFANQLGVLADPKNIIIMGDSAGGNLTASLCLRARDSKGFTPKGQILIYPCVDTDYSLESKYPSVIENGEDYLLTRENMQEYISYYMSDKKDLENPYFAPTKAKDFKGLPQTLLITAQLDPLRDEGEAYARKLLEAGNKVEHHRIADAIHGYFSLSIKHFHTKETLTYITGFLEGM